MTTLNGQEVEIIILTLQPLWSSRIEVTCLKAKDGLASGKQSKLSFGVASLQS